MPVNYPKFDKKIQEQINSTTIQQPRTRPGVIMSFNKMNNTAKIIIEDQNSELSRSILSDVPCPVSKGVQSVSPVVGTRCLVAFRDANEASPYILNYFEDTKLNTSYYINYVVQTGIPKFMVS